MKNRQENRNGYPGIMLFLFACFFFICAASDIPTDHSCSSIQIVYSVGSHKNNDNACVSGEVPSPSRDKSCLTIRYNTNLNLFQGFYKLAVDNIRISAQIAMLNKTRLLIKPLIPVGFRFYHSLADTEDPPLLS